MPGVTHLTVDRRYPTKAKMEVWPEEGKRKPGLDFLHAGDMFSAANGKDWRVDVARQSQHGGSGADRTEVIYSWEYEMTLVP